MCQMPLQTKEDLTDDKTFCLSNLSYLDLSNVDEYHLAYSCTEDAIDIETATDHEDPAELIGSYNPNKELMMLSQL